MEEIEALPDGLRHALTLGLPLLAFYPTNRALSKYALTTDPRHPDPFTRDPQEILDLYQGRGDKQGRGKGHAFRLFRFRPSWGRLLCLDIDRKPGKEDGLKNFYSLFDTLPQALADIEGGSFPVYTRTPSGGFHLFFKYTGGHSFPAQNLAPEVEVKHDLITCPGSRKTEEGPEYTLTGSLDRAPALPWIIEKRLTTRAQKEAQKPVFQFTYKRDQKGAPSLEYLAQMALKDNPGGLTRNPLCHEVAKRAARPEYPYTVEDVVSFLESWPDTAGHDQIRDAVLSAFQHRGKA